MMAVESTAASSKAGWWWHWWSFAVMVYESLALICGAKWLSFAWMSGLEYFDKFSFFFSTDLFNHNYYK